MSREPLLTIAQVSVIKARINKGDAVSDLALEHQVPYSTIYNIYRETCWKEIEPRIIGRERAKISNRTELEPMLYAWGYCPSGKKIR